MVSISAIHPETMTLPYTRKRFILPSEILEDALYLGAKESAYSLDIIKGVYIKVATAVVVVVVVVVFVVVAI